MKFLVIGILILSACSDPNDRPPPYVSYDSGFTQINFGVVRGSCVEGAERKCSIQLGQHDGIVNCFVGVQVCLNKMWGPCEDPDGG